MGKRCGSPRANTRAGSRQRIWCISSRTVLEGVCKPSIEYQMHAAAYLVRPGTTGAVHTHAPVATAFGICNQAFPPINTDAVFLRDTVTVPWYMPGSKELADAVAVALEKSRS